MTDGYDIPPRTDLIESLYGLGELAMDDVHTHCGSVEAAWRIVPHLVDEQIASLWICEEAERGVEGVVERELERWEIEQLVRTRLRGSGESLIRESRLVLKAGPHVERACLDEFWPWFEQKYRKAD